MNKLLIIESDFVISSEVEKSFINYYKGFLHSTSFRSKWQSSLATP